MKRSRLRRRTPLVRSSWTTRRGRIKPLTAKAQRFAAELNAQRPLVAHRSGGLCEAQIQRAGCTLAGEHIHHVARRRGPDANAIGNLLHLCHRCHEWIHLHPRQSYEAGWLVSGLGKIAPPSDASTPPDTSGAGRTPPAGRSETRMRSSEAHASLPLPLAARPAGHIERSMR